MVYILLGTGFEESEALAPCDILRRGGVQVALVGVDGPEITGGHGITVRADLTVEQLDRARRREEVARLTSGDAITDTALQGAEELLCQAERYKEQFAGKGPEGRKKR